MLKVKTAGWMNATFLVALILVLAIYWAAPPSLRLGMALRATARWSFLWFCLATYGGALAALFGSIFQPLASRARDFGLAFAAAQSAHVALAVWLLYRSPDPFPSLQLIVFSIGVFWTYVLALLSLIPALNTRVGIRRSKALTRIGVEYIAFAFASIKRRSVRENTTGLLSN